MTSSVPIEEVSEREEIERFTETVFKHKSGNYPAVKRSLDGHVFPPTEGVTTNRGNKLLQGSQGISRTQLNNSIEIKEENIFYNGSEHKLLSRKPPLDRDESSNEDWDDEKETDLNTLVDVRETLTPISSLEDVVRHPAVSRTFKNGVLKELALRAVLMVEKEQTNVINYSRLLEVFLGEHPGPIREETLQLEPYDHNLRLPDDNEEGASAQNVDKNRVEINPHDDDPFFALPHFNPADTLPSLIGPEKENMPEEVEATRQLAQIALQRNQEFIRNLQKIRNCIIKANRIRERILMWGKEYAGEAEEDVTVPSALHVVKRGLISATTNKTMTEEEAEEEIEGE
ncbi:LAFE_0G16534g1_1 [Lachancea fermentati]|uniref:LAFE_0G16534g1_1 n=1 Tax=Lachancea fermentati TaxID=4955 RepID=A0A1G4MIJ5_LACFM|nr:LAFE_0G16534g1_1 [Lachancea fermentati]